MDHTRKNNHELIVAVKEKLRERGFVASSIDRYNCCWKKLFAYMQKQDISDYNPQVGMGYLEKICGITTSGSQDRRQRLNIRAIKLLNDFLRTGTIFPKSPKISAANSLNVFHSLLSDFKQYQHDKYEASVKTLESYDTYAGRFLMYLENHIGKISCIDSFLIIDYCKSLVEYTENVAHRASCVLRVFLRYLRAVNLVAVDYSCKVPLFTYRRRSKLPSLLKNEEVEKMLSSIDRSSAVGKRDYAIVLIARRLGLRSGDIRNLEFSHIHWESNTIELITQKNGKTLILPLLADVGMAIIDYIKYARPKSESPVIFLTGNAPIKQISAPGMSSIVKRVANQAGVNTIPNRSMGPHSLRSTLASTMLANDVPLPVISGILGHSQTRTTQQYYLRINKKQLQQCALDVPRFPWEPERGGVSNV